MEKTILSITTPDGEQKDYSLVVLRVISFDEHGRPSQVTIGYDDTVFDLSDESQSREFYTAFIPTIATAAVTAQ